MFNSFDEEFGQLVGSVSTQLSTVFNPLTDPPSLPPGHWLSMIQKYIPSVQYVKLSGLEAYPSQRSPHIFIVPQLVHVSTMAWLVL